MCGFAAKIWFEAGRPADTATTEKMGALLAHRGPDEARTLVAGEGAFAFRRLAVIDVAGGHQPLQNEDGRYTLVFNGEIYNYRPRMKALEERGHRFATRCDAEVIVHLYEEKGADCLSYLDGMFAFAVWDRVERVLFLARDRAGEKPLHWCRLGECIIFASEIKALLHERSLERSIDERALAEYLTYQYVPAPRTILKNISKLEPASWVRIEMGRGSGGPTVRSERYWRPTYEPKAPQPLEDTKREVIELLDRAVASRLESEVPLGILLSGGIDSSTIVALARRHIAGPLRTFSVGFEEDSHNELPYARQVAELYSTEHEELIVRPQNVESLPQIVWHADEPFGDASALPTYYLSQMTRKYVTVGLGGEGGDETFGGYKRYAAVPDGTGFLNRFDSIGQEFLRSWTQFMPGWIAPPSVLVKYARKTASHISPSDRQYCRWMKVFSPEFLEEFWTGDPEVLSPPLLRWLEGCLSESGAIGSADRRMASDLRAYLPHDLMLKIDRMSMAHSLEVRAPFLSIEVMEYTAKLPTEKKFLHGDLKGLLRAAAAPLLPKGIAGRQKKGLTIPFNAWIRDELRRLPEVVLLNSKAVGRGFLDAQAVKRLILEHQQGQSTHGRRIWALIMFELWARTFLDPASPPEGPMEEMRSLLD